MSASPSPSAIELGRRLRELREGAPVRLTQGALGRVLSEGRPLSPATISMWEKGQRTPPKERLNAYALLFCTNRSFESGIRMLARDRLSVNEQVRLNELAAELIELRQHAEIPAATMPARPRSMWDFPDGTRITLASALLPDELRPVFAQRGHRDQVRAARLADLDALIDVYGVIRAYNPTSRVVITSAEELSPRDLANHLVLVGGLAWRQAAPQFARIFSLPIDPDDPGASDAITAHQPDGTRIEFPLRLDGGELAEDVGIFVRGANPFAPKRTITICSGVTTRGVRGAAQCFIDPEMRERNERYVIPRFPAGSVYCIVMRVPLFNGEALTPDLEKPENRLFEWSDDPGAGSE